MSWRFSTWTSMDLDNFLSLVAFRNLCSFAKLTNSSHHPFAHAHQIDDRLPSPALFAIWYVIWMSNSPSSLSSLYNPEMATLFPILLVSFSKIYWHQISTVQNKQQMKLIYFFKKDQFYLICGTFIAKPNMKIFH